MRIRQFVYFRLLTRILGTVNTEQPELGTFGIFF